MNEIVTNYFAGEKNAGLMVAAIGVAMLAAGGALFPRQWELRSFAWTLLAWGALELAIGAGLYLKTGPQMAELAAQLANDGAGFFAAETGRMAKVQRNFAIIEYVWLMIVLCAVAAVFVLKSKAGLRGVALGMLINTAVLLAFDVIAERRGAVYFAALRAGPGAHAGGAQR